MVRAHTLNIQSTSETSSVGDLLKPKVALEYQVFRPVDVQRYMGPVLNAAWWVFTGGSKYPTQEPASFNIGHWDVSGLDTWSHYLIAH